MLVLHEMLEAILLLSKGSFCIHISFPFEIGINSQPHLLSNEQQQERRKERDLVAQAKRADLKMANQTSASRASSTQSNTEGLAVYEDNVQNFINVNEDPYTICKPDNEVGCINSQPVISYRFS